MAAGDAILLCIPALPIHTGMLNRSRSLHRRVAENPGNRKSQVYPQLGTVFPVQFSLRIRMRKNVQYFRRHLYARTGVGCECEPST